MTLARKFVMVGAAAVAALLVMSVVASTASAQAALPFKAFGAGLKAGAAVEAFKGTVSVGKATANATGQWQIDIQPGTAAGTAANGDVISFKVDGVNQAQTITFQSGQFTPVPGLTLTAAAAAPAPAPAPAAPAPGKTGNAGLVGTSAGAGIFEVGLLLTLAVAAVGGARLATRRAHR